MIKTFKQIILMVVCLFSVNAMAEFTISLKNKLGNDRVLDFAYIHLTDESGNALGDDFEGGFSLNLRNDPAENNRVFILKKGVETDSIGSFRGIEFSYANCDAGTGSCEGQGGAGAHCPISTSDLNIDTSDKVLDTGVNSITYETKRLRLILRDNLTVGYVVVRKAGNGDVLRDTGNLNIEFPVNGEPRTCQSAT